MSRAAWTIASTVVLFVAVITGLVAIRRSGSDQQQNVLLPPAPRAQPAAKSPRSDVERSDSPSESHADNNHHETFVEGPGDQAIATTGWNVDSNPPGAHEDLDYPEDISIRIAGSGHRNLIFPTTRSPFVLVETSEGGKIARSVWDLQTSREVGVIHGALRSDTAMALSADGSYLALASSLPLLVEVWSVAKGELVRRIDLVDQVKAVRHIDFAAGHQLIIGDWQSRAWHVWHLKTGERRQIAAPNCSFDVVAMSPGRRYLAWFNEDQCLVVLDLGSEPKLHRLPLPQTLKRTGRSCEALTFSPSGDKVAALFEAPGATELFCWDLATGKIEKDHQLKEKPHSARLAAGLVGGSSLEWLEDGAGWLVNGSAIVHHEHGGPIWKPVRDDAGATPVFRPLDKNRLLMIDSKHGQRVLSAVSLPRDEIAHGIVAVKAGGKAEDRNAPALTKADWSSAQRLAPDPGDVPWTVALDPAKFPGRATTAQAVPLETPTDTVRQVLFSPPPEARSLVVRGPRPVGRGGAPIERTWDRFDLRSGERLDSASISTTGEFTALNSDASQVAVLALPSKERLDVYNVASGKHVVGWRPYDQPATDPASEITFTGFVDRAHLLTSNRRGQMVLWKLPECKAVYSYTAADPINTQVALSSSGKYTAISGVNSIHILDSLTGKTAGSIKLTRPSSGTNDVVKLLSFDPHQSRLAVVRGADEFTRLEVWNLDKGELLSTVGLDQSVPSVVWCGDQYLVCEPGRLVDLTQSLPAWRYELLSGYAVGGNYDGRYWYVARRAPAENATLIGLPLPDQEAKKKLAAAKAPDPIVAPGTEIGLDVKVQCAPQQPRLVESLEANFKKMLSSQRFVVSPKAPLTLTVNVDESPTNEQIHLKLITLTMGRPTELQFPETRIKGHLALTDSQGETLWESTKNFETPRHLPLAFTAETEILQSLRDSQWTSALKWLEDAYLPSTIYARDVRNGWGRSTLTIEGVQAASASGPGLAQPQLGGIQRLAK